MAKKEKQPNENYLFEKDPLDPDDINEVVESTSEDEEYYPVEYSISSYGADYPVDGLVKRIKSGSIYIPKYQRSYVWNIYRASRFIESLLLGLPVPAIFLSREQDSNKMLVIDGQQRLRTLQYFYDEIFYPTEKVFKLKGVDKRFADATYNSLNENDRLRLDDSILHAIIIKQDKPEAVPGSEPSSIYHIFERLNTGGVLLHPQEIRTCVCQGTFVELLELLNKDSNWRDLFGSVSARMRDRELILRFFALYFNHEKYSKPMKEFLTKFFDEKRNIESEESLKYKKIFEDTCRICNTYLGKKAFKPKNAVNAALCDSVMFGIAERIKQGTIKNPKALKGLYNGLIADINFQKAISSATTDETNVADRLDIAKEHFETCP
ncbi:MAG: DUF262 domain-containing protein [Anaerohalosphaeraceae bacterium]